MRLNSSVTRDLVAPAAKRQDVRLRPTPSGAGTFRWGLAPRPVPPPGTRRYPLVEAPSDSRKGPTREGGQPLVGISFRLEQAVSTETGTPRSPAGEREVFRRESADTSRLHRARWVREGRQNRLAPSEPQAQGSCPRPHEETPPRNRGGPRLCLTPTLVHGMGPSNSCSGRLRELGPRHVLGGLGSRRRDRLVSVGEPARLVPLAAGSWGWRGSEGVGQTRSCCVRWRVQARHQRRSLTRSLLLTGSAWWSGGVRLTTHTSRSTGRARSKAPGR